MGREKFTETRDYLGLWLERSRQTADAAPRVQEVYEEMDWVVRTLEHCPPEAVNVPLFQVDGYADSVFERIKSELPMIPAVDQTILTSATSMGISSSSAVVAYVEDVSRLQTEDAKRFASRSLSEYRQLQDAHQRPEQVGTLLRSALPTLLSRFESARNAYEGYKSGHESETAVALEMRTFLDGLKGELFERARRSPKENMTFDIVVQRLFALAPTRPEVEQQFAQRSSLFESLSAVAKQRAPSQLDDIHALWARVLDHSFIVVSALN